MGAGFINRIFAYYPPNLEKVRGSSIVVYGAGEVGREYCDYICRCLYRTSAVAIVDENSNDESYFGIPIIKMEQLINVSYDYVLISEISEYRANTIIKQLTDFGVDNRKILWQKPRCKNILAEILF